MKFFEKKRPLGENLSEALKADGKGENLMEAPLLSFKKREKKRKKEKKKKKEKTNKETRKTGSRFDNSCKLQVFHAGKEVPQLKDKGPYYATR